LYDEAHYARLASRPGITGIWQVYGRSRVTFEKMVEMDINYVKQSSIFFDLKLLLLTIVSVASLKGAA
jgi:lipopolysaccharide/colanic/teichoic acid biosynthesis glycosyltransferase